MVKVTVYKQYKILERLLVPERLITTAFNFERYITIRENAGVNNASSENCGSTFCGDECDEG